MLLSMCKARLAYFLCILFFTFCLGCTDRRLVVSDFPEFSSVPRRDFRSLLGDCNRWSSLRQSDLLELRTSRAGPAGPTIYPEFCHGRMIHLVRPGDTLYSLSRSYYGDGRYWREIYACNRKLLGAGHELNVSWSLFLPMDPLFDGDVVKSPLSLPDYYIIAPGDTLYRISEIFLGNGRLFDSLLEANAEILPSPKLLRAGMAIRIAR